MTPTRMATIAAVRAALVLLPLAGPAMAQPAPEQPTEGPKLDPKQNNAAKLAGLIGFVNASCPESKPDFERFKAVVTQLGVAPADLETGELHMRAMSYIEAYRKDVPGNCARALQNFGEAGTTIPGLIGKR